MTIDFISNDVTLRPLMIYDAARRDCPRGSEATIKF